MLEGVDTGLEGKFDFPAFGGPPEIVYMLATVPRTGSSFFSHALWRSGCLGAPLEYLNFDPAGPYSFASSSPDLQQRLWRSVLRRRTSPNGVFGFKCFPMQLQALEEGNQVLLAEVLAAALPRDRPKRIVYLARRDRVAHAISYARATLSGIWRKEQEEKGGVPVEYSQKALETAEHWIDLQTDVWERMFADLRIEPLRLWYEDVAARPGEAVGQVAAFLGVALDPGAEIEVPAVLKQSESDSVAWAMRYAEAKGGGTPRLG
jgi:LPS sulfotransferase NodH